MERSEDREKESTSSADSPAAEPVEEEDMEVDSQGDKLQHAVDQVTEGGQGQTER